MNQEDVGFYKTPWGEEAYCKKCGGSVDWVVCEQCGGEGFDGHECGEDTCCCLYPEDNVPCDICDGEGGWYHCLTCDAKEASL